MFFSFAHLLLSGTVLGHTHTRPHPFPDPSGVSLAGDQVGGMGRLQGRPSSKVPHPQCALQRGEVSHWHLHTRLCPTRVVDARMTQLLSVPIPHWNKSGIHSTLISSDSTKEANSTEG